MPPGHSQGASVPPFSLERRNCCEGRWKMLGHSRALLLLPGFRKCLFLLCAGPRALVGGEPACSALSRQPWMSASMAWLPVPCATLVTLDSCCLGFPTCWAEIRLLAESAGVLMRQGLAGTWAPGKVVCHGFLKRWRGRRGRCQHGAHTTPLTSSAGSGSRVAASEGPTSEDPRRALNCDSMTVAKEGLVPGLEG